MRSLSKFDFSMRSLNLKEAKLKQVELPINPNNTDNLFEEIEDMLYDAGMIDLDEESS